MHHLKKQHAMLIKVLLGNCKSFVGVVQKSDVGEGGVE